VVIEEDGMCFSTISNSGSGVQTREVNQIRTDNT
jgi:hypothetical protein